MPTWLERMQHATNSQRAMPTGRFFPQRDPEVHLSCGTSARKGVMKRYLIERNIPGVGSLNGQQLKEASATSNAALAELGGKVQWVESYVVDDKTFCIYLADDESSVHDHAKLSGFPASKVTEVRTVIAPMTAV
jgi:hypothetical protein